MTFFRRVMESYECFLHAHRVRKSLQHEIRIGIYNLKLVQSLITSISTRSLFYYVIVGVVYTFMHKMYLNI